MTQPKVDSPGVAIPPPLIYVGGFLIGLALGRLWPLAAIPHHDALPLGLISLAAWLTTWTAALPLFARLRTPLSTAKPVTNLITAGIYALTRNPLYVGWTFLYLAIAFLMSAWWPIVLLIPVSIVVDQYVVRREEHYLERRFGDQYRDYKQRVRRWL